MNTGFPEYIFQSASAHKKHKATATSVGKHDSAICGSKIIWYSYVCYQWYWPNDYIYTAHSVFLVTFPLSAPFIDLL